MRQQISLATPEQRELGVHNKSGANPVSRKHTEYSKSDSDSADDVGVSDDGVDTVSLLATAALGHHRDKQKTGATCGPREGNHAGQQSTKLLDTLCRGVSSVHAQEFSEKCEANGSSSSSARKTDQQKAESTRHVEGWSVYDNFRALEAALRNPSSVLGCWFCGQLSCGERGCNRTQSAEDAYQNDPHDEGLSYSDSLPRSEAEVCRMSTPRDECRTRTPQAVKEASVKENDIRGSGVPWIQLLGRSLERASSAPAPASPMESTRSVARRFTTSSSLNTTGQVLPTHWTDHICYYNEHANALC